MRTTSITNEDLIKRAMSVIKPRKIAYDFLVGDVGCALLTDAGNVYLGVCIDASSGMGFCAEHSAIAAMVTAGEHRIKRIVAVLGDGTILYPCGRCREFINQIHTGNYAHTEILLSRGRTATLEQLLPMDG